MKEEFMVKKEEEIKEDFCPACLAVPLAFVSAGAGVYGSSGSRKNYRRKKKICLISSVITLISACFIAYYYLSIKNCKKCLKG